MIKVAIALIHHPVLNKHGETIGSAVTNLDLHDIARAARTFGVQKYYITTPYNDQQELIKEIVDHWQTGHGATYNPARKEALSQICVTNSLDEAIADAAVTFCEKPLVVTTSAKRQQELVSFSCLREKIEQEHPILLVFGTAHGLSQEIMDKADMVLPPISGKTDYNHLSVRSAAAIVMDRLLGY